MAKDDYWPAWYRISLSVVCLLGAVYAIAVDRPYLAGFAFLAGIMGLVVARRRPAGAGQPAGSSRVAGAVAAVGFAALAVGAVVFLLDADGNVTAYVVGGVVLAIALYAVVAVAVRMRQLGRRGPVSGSTQGGTVEG
ncbi:hypothetical protein ACN26Y_05140 [Micromonospora sp. WMMD558]|uniref:hypothetical protein n=1 Tax=Micromonospora sp. WMMD558 TaxID=3403462 RepID=UPI003BF513EA